MSKNWNAKPDRDAKAERSTKFAGLPEDFVSKRGFSKAISRMVQAGTARKLGTRLFTRNLTDTPERIVARNLWPIAALLAPGTVVSHRTAFENTAAPDGSVFLSGAYPRQIALPSVTLRQVPGPGPAPGDLPYMGSLFLASRPRAFLENLLPSRRRTGVARTVGREGVEERLAEILRAGGEEALNRLRDEVRAVARRWGWRSRPALWTPWSVPCCAHAPPR